MVVVSLRLRARGRSGACARGRSRSSRASPGPPQQQRFTSFYLTAMLFIVFDIEIVFLYPLAVVLDELALVRLRRVPLLHRDPRARLRLHLAEGGARVAVDEAARATTGSSPSACSGRRRARASSSRRSANLEQQARADDAREGGRVGADEVDVARHVRARLLRDRDDVDRLGALRHRALRDGGVPRLAAPGRPADRLRPRRRTRWPRRCGRSTTRCSSRSG